MERGVGNFDPGKLSVGKVPGDGLFLRAPAEPLLEGDVRFV